jgi:23S rRNA (pseudouridine1915-N3)-methyltransferase
MFNITILAIGKVKESYINTAIVDYLKRLSPYGKIKIEELKAEKFAEHSREQAKRVEAERIESYLAKRTEARVVLLDEGGQTMDSQAFSQWLLNDQRPLILVIAGTLGWEEGLKKRYREKLSLSPMTLTHEMARLILVEQIYRGVAIEKGKAYHY